MSSWLKRSSPDFFLPLINIQRLSELRSHIDYLTDFVYASQSDAYRSLIKTIETPLVRGRVKILESLMRGVEGENNQKLALDSPKVFSEMMREALIIIDREIVKENNKLKEMGYKKQS